MPRMCMTVQYHATEEIEHGRRVADRYRKGFLIEEPNGHLRPITNLEMSALLAYRRVQGNERGREAD